MRASTTQQAAGRESSAHAIATRRGPMHHAACTAVRLRALGVRAIWESVVFGTSKAELGAAISPDQESGATAAARDADVGGLTCTCSVVGDADRRRDGDGARPLASPTRRGTTAADQPHH